MKVTLIQCTPDAEKIISMQDIIPSSDKVVFTCHKADLSKGLFKSGKPIVKQFFNDIKNVFFK